MAVTIKKAVLWRRELENHPGTLASTLKPLAEAGVSLQVVMGYAIPGEHEHAAVEVWPIEGSQAENAAAQAGLHPSPQIACLIVTGDDIPGLGHHISDRLAQAGINISFVMVQAADDLYHGVFGFASQEDADRAVAIIKEIGDAVKPKRKPRAASARKPARKTGAKKTAGAAAKRGGKAAGKKITARGGARKAGARKTAAKKTAGRSKAKSRKR